MLSEVDRQKLLDDSKKEACETLLTLLSSDSTIYNYFTCKNGFSYSFYSIIFIIYIIIFFIIFNIKL